MSHVVAENSAKTVIYLVTFSALACTNNDSRLRIRQRCCHHWTTEHIRQRLRLISFQMVYDQLERGVVLCIMSRKDNGEAEKG